MEDADEFTGFTCYVLYLFFFINLLENPVPFNGAVFSPVPHECEGFA